MTNASHAGSPKTVTITLIEGTSAPLIFHKTVSKAELITLESGLINAQSALNKIAQTTPAPSTSLGAGDIHVTLSLHVTNANGSLHSSAGPFQWPDLSANAVTQLIALLQKEGITFN